MKFGFVTCVRLGLEVMEEIYLQGGALELAVSLPDDKAKDKSGRIYLDEFCETHGIDLVKSPNVNDAVVVEAIRAHDIDWLFIIGWSQIARKDLLEAPRRGVIGMHPTLLPEGRGRASVPWAIIKGLPETGVTMFVLDEGVDTGPILAQVKISLTDESTATELYAEVEAAHRQLLRTAWPDLVADRLKPAEQDPESGSVWPGRTPQDGEIDPAGTVQDALCLVRATTRPYPGAFWRTGEGVIRVWRAAPGDTGEGPVLFCRDGSVTAIEYEFEGAT